MFFSWISIHVTFGCRVIKIEMHPDAMSQGSGLALLLSFCAMLGPAALTPVVNSCTCLQMYNKKAFELHLPIIMIV